MGWQDVPLAGQTAPAGSPAWMNVPVTKPSGPVFQPLQDYGRDMGAAGMALIHDIGDRFQATKAQAMAPAPNLAEAAKQSAANIMGLPRMLLEGVTALTSPIWAVPDALVAAPAGRLAAKAPIKPMVAPKLQVSNSGLSLTPARDMTDDETMTAVRGAVNTAFGAAQPVRGAPGSWSFGKGATGPQDIASLAPPILPPISQSDLKVGAAIERALKADKVDPLEMVNRAMADKTGLPFHNGGENMINLADVAVQSPGEAGQTIIDAIRGHQAKAVSAVKGDIGTSLGGTGDYLDTLDEVIKARSDAASEGIGQIQDHLVTLDPDSVSALRSVRAKAAIKDHAENLLSSMDPEIRADGARLNRLHDDLLDKPGAQTITVRDAQEISRSLLNGADSAFKGGDNGRGIALKSLGRTIRDNAGNPDRGGFQEYADWLKKYGEDSATKDALELGNNIFAKKNTAEAVGRAVKDMSEPARDMFRKGVGEALLDQVRSTKGDVGALRQLLRGEDFSDRLKFAFPDSDSFDAFMQSAAKRVRQQDINSRISAGSPTYRRAAARADLEAQTGKDPIQMAIDAVDAVTSPAKATGKAMKRLLDNIPRKDRSIIGDPEMNATLGKALTDPAELQRLMQVVEEARARAAAAPKFLPRALPTADLSGTVVKRASTTR